MKYSRKVKPKNSKNNYEKIRRNNQSDEKKQERRQKEKTRE